MASTSTTYSIAEAATELGLTERRVRQLIDENKLVADTDGMGRTRLTKAQVAAELKRRGRVSVKSLPSLPDGTLAVDPLIERIEETNELLRDLLDLARTLAANQVALMAIMAPAQLGKTPAKARRT